jgi:hypothetical protein
MSLAAPGTSCRVRGIGAALVRRYMLGAGALKDIGQTYVRTVGGDWRDGFEHAWRAPDSEPDEGPGLNWRQLTLSHWSGT